jgi:AcrR family transcriptional regulator
LIASPAGDARWEDLVPRSAQRPGTDTTAKPVRGRPRDPAIEVAVIAVTRRLLVEVGYHRVTFEAVAKAAGTTRPTLYARWPSKAHLVHDAVIPRSVGGMPDSGDLATDLRAFVSAGAALIGTPLFRAAYPGLVADFSRDPVLLDAVAAQVWTTVRESFTERVGRARAADAITFEGDPNDVLDALVGGLFHRAIVFGAPLDDYVEPLTLFGLRALGAR